jgi:hypothetical protein
MFIPKNSLLWEIQQIDDIYLMGIFFLQHLLTPC